MPFFEAEVIRIFRNDNVVHSSHRLCKPILGQDKMLKKLINQFSAFLPAFEFRPTLARFIFPWPARISPMPTSKS
jgi:hypothetical protein